MRGTQFRIFQYQFDGGTGFVIDRFYTVIVIDMLVMSDISMFTDGFVLRAGNKVIISIRLRRSRFFNILVFFNRVINAERFLITRIIGIHSSRFISNILLLSGYLLSFLLFFLRGICCFF